MGTAFYQKWWERVLTFGEPVATSNDACGKITGELRDLFSRGNDAFHEIASFPVVIQIDSRTQNLKTKVKENIILSS